MNIIYKEGIWIIGKQEQQTWWPRPFNISKSAAQGLCLPRLVQRNPKAHSRNCINREKEIYYGGKAHEKERNTLHANLKVFNHWQFFLSGRCLKPLNVAIATYAQRWSYIGRVIRIPGYIVRQLISHKLWFECLLCSEWICNCDPSWNV